MELQKFELSIPVTSERQVLTVYLPNETTLVDLEALARFYDEQMGFEFTPVFAAGTLGIECETEPGTLLRIVPQVGDV